MAAKVILKDCIITHKDSELIKTYDVKAGLDVFHTGIDIKCSELYSPCYGVCIYNGLIDGRPSCTIQYSHNISLRYMHLYEVLVEAGQLIPENTLIGKADGYVHFEYLTSERSYPYFRVFFNAQNSYSLYKHDPMLVITGNVQFDHTPMAGEQVGQYQALEEDGKGSDEL